MNPSSFTPESRALLADGSPCVRMVMIYEDGLAGRRAKRFADEVCHGVGGDCDGTCSFWNFDALEHTDVRNAAAGAAAGADFVVVAASSERGLSPEINEWLHTWERMIGENNPALVALLEGDGDGSGGGIRSGLDGIARHKDLEFVAFHFDADRE